MQGGAQIRPQDAEGVFKLLSSHEQELSLDHMIDIRKQSALEKAEGPEPEPEDRTMTVSRFTEGVGITSGV